ncbi:MAG: Uma2 family endonuclease [Defluviitaleaceae bacterium]|nr:Uma2 family endonuclease [Defluviitaleaceae bacterium]
MDLVFMGMGTTELHRDISMGIAVQLINLGLRDKKIMREDCDLTYYGKRHAEDNCNYLVNTAEIADTKHFVDNVITQLSVITPDIMLLSKEKVIFSKNGVRVAGFPDLIVEIWSDSNYEREIHFKKNLYATAATTEQWYITQDSPIFERYIGEEKQAALDLREVVHTKDGFAIDLRGVFP